MSGTMPISDNMWPQFHENNQPLTVQSWSDMDGANVTTIVTTPTPNPNHSISNQLNRVTRPTIARRRSRASRKPPTTLLNTDATNFRAMVQRFTGGGNNGYDVTSTRQALNNYTTASSSSLGVPALRPNESYNMEFRRPNSDSQPYYSVAEDGAGGSVTADRDYEDDQHMGYRQIGSFNW